MKSKTPKTDREGMALIPIDFCRSLERDTSHILSIAEELFESLIATTTECHTLHHSKKDYHSLFQDCPVEKRIEEAIRKYNQFISERCQKL